MQRLHDTGTHTHGGHHPDLALAVQVQVRVRGRGRRCGRVRLAQQQHHQGAATGLRHQLHL